MTKARQTVNIDYEAEHPWSRSLGSSTWCGVLQALEISAKKSCQQEQLTRP